MSKVVVIGGGISGLSAAYQLTKHLDPSQIALIESTDRLGGTIKGTLFENKWIETGPDSFITRNRAALDLAIELGLEDLLISPATNAAHIFLRNILHPIPKGTVFGAPANFDEFLKTKLISTPGKIRAILEPLQRSARIDGDTTVGSFATRRWGKEVASNLIDPLVGGIHAGDAFELSLAKCAPQYLKASQSQRSVSRALASQRTLQVKSELPAFYSFDGGLSVLVDALVNRLKNAKVKIYTNSKCDTIKQTSNGFQVVTKNETIDCQKLILATPAHQSTILLKDLSSRSSELLGQIDYSSPVMTLLSYPQDSFEATKSGSGVLVPKSNGILTTAITFASNKWPRWKTDGNVILRVSSGKYRDRRPWNFNDEELVTILNAELHTILGGTGNPNSYQVHRWKNSLPQFKPYHDQLIQNICQHLPSGLALAGSAYLGVGIPACIASGIEAAQRISN